MSVHDVQICQMEDFLINFFSTRSNAASQKK